MGTENNIFGTISTRITVTSGEIVQIGPISGMIASSIKLVSGGTLEIGQYGATFATNNYGFTIRQGTGSSSSIAAGGTFGQGYFLSANEILSMNLSGKFYLFGSGAADCVATVIFGRSQGQGT